MAEQASIRRQLLDNLCQRLAAGTVVKEVFRSMFQAIQAEALPVCAVFPVEEQIEHWAHQGSIHRTFRVRIVYVAGKSEEDLSAALDQIIDSALVEIEQTVVADDTLGGLGYHVHLTRWTWQLEAGEEPFIGAWADVEIEYDTLEDPTVSDR